jgi:hypothetical protein
MDNAGLRTGDERQHSPGYQADEGNQERRQDPDPPLQSVDGIGAWSYFKPEWAVAGSHIIEPTGPMMGPNAVADVMPPGGRQMLW